MVNFVQANSSDKSNLEKNLDMYMLEKRMGGLMEDLTEYWPPRCYEDATKTLDENSLVKYSIIPFTYNDAEFQAYDCQTMSGLPNSSRKMLRCK